MSQIPKPSFTAQIPLQTEVTQTDLFEHIAGDTLLESSLYVNIALAGLTILAVVLLARGMEDPRAKLIVLSTMLISVVSIASYTGLASGLTVSIIEMPDGHAASGFTTTVSGVEVDGVLTMWGRYLTWALSTPLILLSLGLLAGTNLTKLFTAITFDVAMCVTGLAAALTTSSHMFRWFWYAMSSIFFLVVVYILLVEWQKDAERAGTADIFGKLKLLTVVMWFGYPILWALGVEGIAVLEVAYTSWGYSALDIVAKYIVSMLIVLYVVDEPASIKAGTDYGATSGVTPADD
ncbi:MAG: bacteriorhodopsin [Halobacteriales archaeon]|nr:bacteriorhodopsin [Halobacteriales archaeon]